MRSNLVNKVLCQQKVKLCGETHSAISLRGPEGIVCYLFDSDLYPGASMKVADGFR